MKWKNPRLYLLVVIILAVAGACCSCSSAGKPDDDRPNILFIMTDQQSAHMMSCTGNITPNGDGMNDIFRPSNYAFVEKVDMKIYNRWGVLVYQTEDPDINWDGKRMNTDHIVPPGVYYYVCDVFENRLTGLEVRSLSGFVYVFTESDALNPVE